jgi:membrane protease subunit (stomatin/prohibitin family)
VQKSLQDNFEQIGLSLSSFIVENLSFPEEVEKAIDRSSSLGVLGGQMGTYTKMAAADAMVNASKNTGIGGTMMGVGVMGNVGAGMMAGVNQSLNQKDNSDTKPKRYCPDCGTSIFKEGAKFCPICGKPLPAENKCAGCGAVAKEGAKFCPDCGHKL